MRSKPGLVVYVLRWKRYRPTNEYFTQERKVCDGEIEMVNCEECHACYIHRFSLYILILQMPYIRNSTIGRMVRISDVDSQTSKRHGIVHIQCLPVYSILLAIGLDRIDYLSLALSGDELNVLQTIPDNKVDVDVVTIQMYERDQRVISYMTQKNFVFIMQIQLYKSHSYHLLFSKLKS